MNSNFKWTRGNVLRAKQISNSCGGFTVVEILVVVAVIAILPAIIVSNFPEIRSQFALSRSVYQFTQDLRKVEDMALSSVPYVDSLGQLQFVSGYGVYIHIDQLGPTTYMLYADNNDNGAGNHQYDALDYVVNIVDFSSSEPGIVIKELRNVSGGTVSIDFSPPNPVTTITQLGLNQQSVEVVFAIASDLTKTKSVIINTAGLIDIN